MLIDSAVAPELPCGSRVGRRWRVIVIVLLATLAPLGSARAESLESLFSEGNAAYFHGDFATAVKRYEALERAGVRDPDVSFNLATAHARLGHLGYAVLGFERALWLRPGDEGAEEGLLAARAELAKRRADREGEAELQTRPPLTEALARPFSPDALALALLILSALLFACLTGLHLARKPSQRIAVAVAAPLTGLLFLLSAAGLAVKLEVLRDGYAAVVLREGAELREGPDNKAVVRKQAHEGQPARVLRSDGNHSEAQLDTGSRGWMETKDLGRLRMDD